MRALRGIMLGLVAGVAVTHLALARQATKAKQPESATQAARAATARLKKELSLLRATEHETVPPADSFTTGDRAVTAGHAVLSSIGVSAGNLDVSSRITGNAVVVGGDIRVHKGGEITGDAVTVGGHVVLDGGVVDGESLALSDLAPTVVPVTTATTMMDVWDSIKLVISWFAGLMVIGIGVVIFAESTLDGVVMGLERSFAKSFWAGLLGQLLVLPALLVLVVGLAITIIGILLIPFAIVAFAIVFAGLLTLGFLSVARLAGTLLTHNDGGAAPNGVDLRALVYGLGLYTVLWLLPMLFPGTSTVGPFLVGLAGAVTWVSVTAGFGSTLLSRAGTKREGARTMPTLHGDQMAWSTPTPVAGVTSARRPGTPTGAGL